MYQAQGKDMATWKRLKVSYNFLHYRKPFSPFNNATEKFRLIELCIPCKTTGMNDPLENNIEAAPDHKI